MAPIIYDIQNDAHAARFGLQPQERDYLLTRCFPNRNGGRPEYVYWHIQDGTTVGSLDWWVNGPGVQASSTYLVQKDGSILRCIPEKDGPWTNGDVQNPTPESAALRALGGNPNNWCITVEAEGRPWDALPEVQMQAMVWLAQDIMRRYPRITRERMGAHHWLNSVTRANCGRYLPALLARLDGATPAPASPQFGSIVTFSRPVRIDVTASDGLNVRRWGELDAAVMTTLAPGASFFADGYVYGESVAGENRWYIMAGRGYRVWSGGTTGAMLTPGGGS